MVGKITVVISQPVTDYLDDLVRILYKEEYFGFIESAEEYVSKIYDFIQENISLQSHKLTPKSLQSLGSNCIFYKANKRTTWYVFFEKKNYLITGIINSNCKEAKEL